MGIVVAQIKVLPESPETDLAKLKEEIRAAIPEKVKLESITEKPVAFGIVALAVVVTMPDMVEGGTDGVQEAIAKLPTVQSAEVSDVGLL